MLLLCLACISFLSAYIDIDECSNSTLNICDPNANCTNTDGGYMCMCLDGYMGDGEICQGMILPKTLLPEWILSYKYLSSMGKFP